MQLAHDGIPAALVFLPHLLEIFRPDGVECRRCDLVERRDRQPRLTVFEGVAHKLPVAADEAADACAAGGKALGDGIDEDQVFLSVVKLAERMQRLAVVGKLAVDLVGHEIQIVRHGHVEQHFHLRLRETRAGGVAGIGDHDGLRLRRDAGFNARTVSVEIALLRLRVQRMDDAACGRDERVIVRVERLGDDDLVAVVQQTVCRDLQCFAAAGRNEDVGLVQSNADVFIVLPDSFNQFRDAGRGRVGQNRRAEIVDRVVQCVRRVDIGLADIQVINLLSFFLRCHDYIILS